MTQGTANGRLYASCLLYFILRIELLLLKRFFILSWNSEDFFIFAANK